MHGRTHSADSVKFDEPEAHPPQPSHHHASASPATSSFPYSTAAVRTPKLVQSTVVGAALTSPGSFPVPVSSITVSDPVAQLEGGSTAFVTYLIRFYIPNVVETSVRRRYSEFESFRNELMKKYPFVIHPPLPEKQGVMHYAAAQAGSKPDMDVAQLRRRLLERFLQRIVGHPILCADPLFHQFLEARSWSDVLAQEHITKFSSPATLVSTSAASVFSGASSMLQSTKAPDPRFLDAANYVARFQTQMASIEKATRKITKRLTELSDDFGEMGQMLNAFSLEEIEIGPAIERTGSAMDVAHASTSGMANYLSDLFSDMAYENVLYAGSVKACLKARDAKQAEYDSLVSQLDSKRASLGGIDSGSGQPQGNLFSAVASLVDVDPDHTRRSSSVKLREQVATLERSVVLVAEEVRAAGEEVLAELRHFESEKTKDLKNLLILFAKTHLEHAKKNKLAWQDALDEVERLPSHRNTNV